MPARAHQLPQTRVSRDDWVNAARAALAADGITGVKVARLADQLGVQRSSFYWYFDGRPDLDQALLQIWETHNVTSIVERAATTAPSITAAVLRVFQCWADPALFDHRLEFAVRDWARRDQVVRERLARADTSRIEAIAAMHRHFGNDDATALVRARVQFHSQIGLYALGVDEPTEERLRLVATYVQVFTGNAASDAELAAFAEWVHSRRPT